MKKVLIFLVIITSLLISCQNGTPTSIPITPENYNRMDISAEDSVSGAFSLQWTPDSQAIIVPLDNNARILDAWTLDKKSEFPFDGSTYYAFSPDGKILAGPSGDQAIQLTEANSDSLIETISTGYFLNNVDFSADGESLLTSSYDELRVDVWDVESGEKLKTLTGFDTAAPVYNASFAEHSEHVVWLSRGRIQVSDVASGFISMPFEHQDWVTSWALSSDGAKLATSAAADVQGHFVPNVLIWDTASGDLRMLMNSEEPYEGLAFCPDTHILAVAEARQITLIDLEAFSTPKDLSLGGRVMNLAFSPDGSALAAINTDGKLIVWRVPE